MGRSTKVSSSFLVIAFGIVVLGLLLAGATLAADTELPTIDADNSPATAYTGDDYIFDVTVSDNDSVAKVWVEYWLGNSASHTTLDLQRTSGNDKTGTYGESLTMPDDTILLLRYFVHAEDASTNSNQTVVRNVPIMDNDRPNLVDETNATGTTGDPIYFRVSVTDNVGIADVRVEYWFADDQANSTNTSMGAKSIYGIGNGTYEWPGPVPSDFVGTVNYVVSCYDLLFNNISSQSMVTTTDNDAPVIGLDTSDTAGTTGDGIHLVVNVSDNIGVGKVYAMYAFGNIQLLNMSLDPGALDEHGNGTYYLNITAPPDSSRPLRYHFVANDNSGLWTSTVEVRVPVTDNDPPEVIKDYSGKYGSVDTYSFEVNVRDNIGVEDIRVVYQVTGQALMNETMGDLSISFTGNGTYANVSVTLPLEGVVILTYHFEILDPSGNWGRSPDVVKDFSDSVAPTFGEDLTPIIMTKGLEVTFSIEVEDNIGVEEVKVEYWYGTGLHENATMTASNGIYNLTIALPRDPTGVLHYMFWARDAMDNWAATEEVLVVPRNTPPVIAPIPVWNITERDRAELDLEAYISDANDPLSALTLEALASAFTVEGFVLKAIFSEWDFDFVLDIQVTDGEDTTKGNISIHLINVNDDPIITSTAPTTAKVGEAYSYILEFTDEDVQDVHTIALEEAPSGMVVDGDGKVTWTPGSGQEGTVSVDLTVFDGNVTIHQTWDILVTSEAVNEPPTFTNSPPTSANSNETYTWDAEASDPEDEILAFSLDDGPAGATIDAMTGLLEWITPTDKRSITEDFSFTIVVSDSEHDVSMTFTVLLQYPPNSPPVILNGIRDITTKTPHDVDLTSFMSDPDDDVADLHWEIQGGNTKMFTAEMKDNRLLVKPKEGEKGTATLTLLLYDPWGLEDSMEIQVKIEGSDDEGGTFSMTYVAIIVVIVLVVVVALFLLMRRNKASGAGKAKGAEGDDGEEEDRRGDD
jgi:hypothetical protein